MLQTGVRPIMMGCVLMKPPAGHHRQVYFHIMLVSRALITSTHAHPTAMPLYLGH